MAWIGKPVLDEYAGLMVKYLPLNTAYVLLNSTWENSRLYGVSDDCYECPFTRLSVTRTDSGERAFQVHTGSRMTLRVATTGEDVIDRNNRRGLQCEMRPTFGEYGVYSLDVGRCFLQTEVEPINIYLPLVTFALCAASALLAYGLMKCFIKRTSNEGKYADGLILTAQRDNLDAATSPLRLLRGILILIIIFVTTGGGGYPIFNREVGGCCIAEGLFLTFAWSVGFRIPKDVDDASTKTRGKSNIYGNIIKRACVVMLLGTAVAGSAPRWRYAALLPWSPLLRIGCVYFLLATAYLLTKRTLKNPKEDVSFFEKVVSNFSRLLWCWVSTGFLLIFVLISMHVLHSFDCGPSRTRDVTVDVFGEVLRIEADNKLTNCDSGLAEVIIKILIGHNRDQPLYIESYYIFTQGLLGVILTILISFAGMEAGVVFQQQELHTDRLQLWAFWATVFALKGIFFAVLSQILGLNLWPVTTIFLMSALTYIIYMFIYYLIEMRDVSASIVNACGLSSIFVLGCHFLFSQSAPFYWGITLNTHFMHLLQCAWVLLIWIIINIGLKNSKIRITI